MPGAPVKKKEDFSITDSLCIKHSLVRLPDDELPSRSQDDVKFDQKMEEGTKDRRNISVGDVVLPQS